MNRIQHAEAVARAAARYARQAHKVARAMKALADVQEPKIVNIWKQRAAQERQK